MLNYLNGKIVNNAIPNETTLIIKTVPSSKNIGQALSPVFNNIMKEYCKHITAICFIGGEEDQLELADLVDESRKHGLKTCVSTYLAEESKLHTKLLSELDYLQMKNILYKKEYSPFGDTDVWIEIT